MAKKTTAREHTVAPPRSAATVVYYDEAAGSTEDGLVIRVADDLAIVCDDPRVVRVADDLAIVHDPPAPLDDAPERAPVLVDLTGRRAKVVRTLSLGVALGAVALLASVPVALALPEHTAPATHTIAGTTFVDTDCDGTRSPVEPAASGALVELVRDGTVLATVRTAADGSYAFSHVVVDGSEVVRIAPAAAATAPGAATGATCAPAAAVASVG